MWEIFEQLLQEKGITAYQICKDLGISQGTIYNWRTRGNLISSEIGVKIAKYFGISLDYLMTGDEKKRYYTNDEAAIKAQEAYATHKILFDAAEGSRPEDIALAVDFLNRLKETNPDG